jgi:hypothetical protein
MPAAPPQGQAGTPSASAGGPAANFFVPPTTPAPAADLGMLAVLALLASLLGIVGIAYTIYSFKFLGHSTILYLPARVFFVFSLGFAVAPFLLLIFRERIPYVLVLLPTALCFLMYPLMAPHGVVYGQDALFNFQFAFSFLQHSVWVAGGNTTDQAVTYAYYPGSGLFNSEGSVFLGIPLTSSFPWVLPTMRLLILPPLIFAIGSRLLGPRAGMLGVFFYLGAPSITFMDMVQQEFALPFFVLTLAVITFLISTPAEHALPLRILVLVFSSFIILSHHLTSYIMGVWIAGLVVIPLLLWGRPMFDALRAAAVALRYVTLFMLWVLFFTAAVLLRQLSVLEKNLLLLLSSAPITAKAAATGSSYPTYQLIWIIAGLGVVALFAVLTLREAIRGKPRPYLATSLVLGVILLLIAFILFSTPYSFVAIRTTEYALVFGGPAAAWYLTRRFMPAIDKRVRSRARPTYRTQRSVPSGWIAPAIAILIAFFVFSGGNLVPGATRDQLQPPGLLAVNSPDHVTAAVYQDGVWARDHLNPAGRVWGDMLVYDVYAGVGGLVMPFGTYDVFNGTTLSENNSARLHVGDYVVTDIYDTTLAADFYGSRAEEPTGPLNPAQLTKFNNPRYLSVVFADPTFTVYQVTALWYEVNFTESGLPAGTSWSVTLNNSTPTMITHTTLFSTTNTILFLEPAGNYTYYIPSVGTFSASPSRGTISLSGTPHVPPVSVSPVFL